MSFAWPWFFLLLPLPWLLRYGLAPVEVGAALRLPHWPAALAREHSPPGSLWLAGLVWLLLVGACARPQAPGELLVQPVRGRNLMLAFDVSASMGTRDLRMGEQTLDRLSVARRVADDFLQRRQGDRVGLMVFGSQAYLHTPLTFDLAAVRAALTTMEPGFAGPETALGDAIGLATKHMQQLAEPTRELVLLTDGANTAGTLSPARAAWLAQRAGVRIHVIGIGAAATDSGGRAQATGVDEATLQQLAEQSGGSYQRATDSAAITQFFQRLEQLRPGAEGSVASQMPRDLYPWPLGLALALAVGMLLHRMRRGGVA